MDQEKTYKWIQDRLRELNAGTIEAADFHQLETLAKEDPFIADALEGYQLHPDLDHTAYLDSLTQKIKPYKRERRRWLIPNLTVTAVAASLILIVGFYAVMTRMSTKENEGMANATTEHQLTLEKSGDTLSIAADTENTIAAVEQSQPVAAVEVPRPETMRKSVTKPSAAKESKKEVSATNATRSQPADEIYATEDTKTKGVSPPSGQESVQEKMDKQLAAPASAAERQDAGYSANQMAPALMAKRVTGMVIDGASNEPLIFAWIFVQGTNLISTTDIDGKFELFLPNLENEATVSYTGYPDTSFIIKQGEENLIIKLKQPDWSGSPSLAGSEDFIKKYNEGAFKKTTAKIDTLNMMPIHDIAFINYLKSNSKYALADLHDQNVKKVVMDFVINHDGHLSQINVTQSSGDKKLDDEAVRLIRKGPDWQCEASQYPCKVQYSIYFRS